jgi:hypothetical protein
VDLQGIILATNRAWTQFGWENGLTASFDSVGKNYLKSCEQAVSCGWPGAQQAYVGLLEVIRLQRPKFTMVYPCHSPTQRRWYRMWVQPQMPIVPAVIVAHHWQSSKPRVEEPGTTLVAARALILQSRHGRIH